MAREDYFWIRLRRFLAWAEDNNVALLQLAPLASQPEASNLAAVLPQLVVSKVLGAAEFAALCVVCRGLCRLLARPDILESLLRILEGGFSNFRGLAQAATRKLGGLDERTELIQKQLRGLAASALGTLKSELRQGELTGRVTTAHAVLEPTACLVGESSDRPLDSFGARCLLAEGGPVLARAFSFRPEVTVPARRKRFKQSFAKHRQAIQRAAEEGEGVQEVAIVLARWLLVVADWFEELPVLVGLNRAKESLAAYVMPLAAWVLRPHKRAILGRLVPPPDPPDPLTWQDWRDGHQKKKLPGWAAAMAGIPPASKGDDAPVSLILDLPDGQKLGKASTSVSPPPEAAEELTVPAPAFGCSKAANAPFVDSLVPPVWDEEPVPVGRWLQENNAKTTGGASFPGLAAPRFGGPAAFDELAENSGTLDLSSDEEGSVPSPARRASPAVRAGASRRSTGDQRAAVRS
eukprot:TRINITY_DN18688_c0_g1_i2.p1 TRINITY_DN18688_c0_g1~~TRINITY_DN18688_c0_g1_i2.p1  ORF type:complete len:491 (-),score=99.72 TRINITY_DN18688_c0_g1_i2:2-1393(-)